MLTHVADTDRIIDYLKQRPEAVELLQPLVRNAELAFSIVVYAEVYEGLIGNTRFAERADQLAALLAGTTLLDVDFETARVFAEIRRRLRTEGQMIPDHDIWIAATAIRHDLVLVTRDQYFGRIAGLRLA